MAAGIMEKYHDKYGLYHYMVEARRYVCFITGLAYILTSLYQKNLQN